MGLRRTPPPGMDAPTPSRPPAFPSEYPEPVPEPVPPSSPPAAVPPPAVVSPPPQVSTTPVASPPTPQLPSPKLPSPTPPSPRLPRITPRNSLPPSEDTDNITPHAGLVNLARAINRAPPATPQRPTTGGGGAVSNRRSVRRTPGAGRLNPLPAKLTARSPHASRAFETRRAATPGRERRKSGRYPTARETPRDLLRALSRQLAPTTAPYQPTPNPTPAPIRQAFLTSDRRASDILFYSDPGHASDSEGSVHSDPGVLPPAPRLSMNLDELNDEDLGVEPRFSVPLEDLDHTHQSVEFGRRAVSEQPWGGRASFGIRLSDRFVDLEGGAESEVGEETVGDVSVMVGEESMGLGDLGVESGMGFVDEEEEGQGDVTMRSELELDEGDSVFLSLPTLEDGIEVDEDGEEEEEEELDQLDQMLPDYDNDLENDTISESGADRAHDHEPKLHINPPADTKLPKKTLPLSRHGHPVPAFPRAVIKKMAQKFSGGATISNETLNAIVTASEAFFEQVSDDLAVYAGHAGRRTIEDADVVQLLKRQRLITPQTTAFSLAARHLPRELLQEVRMSGAKRERRSGKRGKKGLESVVEEEGE